MLTIHKSQEIMTSDNKITGEWVVRWTVNGVYHMQAGFASEALALSYAHQQIDRDAAITVRKPQNTERASIIRHGSNQNEG